MKLGIFTIIAALSFALPSDITHTDVDSTFGAMAVLILLIVLLGAGEWAYGMRHRDQVADDDEFNELMASREAQAVAEEMEDRP